MNSRITKLIISLVGCQLAGIIGSFFTAPSISTWYAVLEKPFFVPPNWLFAPAWILLYFLMGISAYLIWIRGFEKKEVREALMFFTLQLILNTIWSVLFFGLLSPLWGFVEIIFLWLAILFTILKFYPLSRKAAYLLIPYILWVSFAALLNFSILMLNG